MVGGPLPTDMARGILGLVGLGATLALAVPIGLFGLDYLLRGRTLMGAAALGIAVLMVVVEEHLTTAGDVPGKVAGEAVDAVVKEPDEEREE